MNQTIQLTEAQKLIRRERLTAGGRKEAWTFVVQCNWDFFAIEEKLAEKEAHRIDPDFTNGSMKMGASPRLFIDGYISALQEAVKIINAQQQDHVSAIG